MSTSYYSYAIIGCEIVREKIPVTIKKKRAFNHNYLEDSPAIYDTLTGKKLWEEVIIPKYLFMPDYHDNQGELDWQQDENIPGIEQDNSFLQIKANLKGLAVFSDIEEKFLVLGIGASSCYANTFADFRALDDINIKQIKERVRSVLEPIGLWDGTKFGLYSILLVC